MGLHAAVLSRAAGAVAVLSRVGVQGRDGPSSAKGRPHSRQGTCICLFIQPTRQTQKCLLCTGAMLESGGTEKEATRKNEEAVEYSERDHTG